MKMLTPEERHLLAVAVMENQNDRALNTRAMQTVDPKKLHGAFSVKIKGRKMLKQVELSDFWFDKYLDISKSSINLEEVKPVKDIEEIEKTIKNIQAPVKEEDKVVTIKRLSKANTELYKNYFKELQDYDTEVIEINILEHESGEREVEVKLLTSSVYTWKINLPYIDKQGFFKKNGSEYCFMYTPKNLIRFLNKQDDRLYLYHPFEKLVHEMLIAYKTEDNEVKIAKNYFNAYVSKCNGRTSIKLQKNINKFITNSKDFFWEKDSTSPIVWFDRELGTLGRYSFTNNILLDMSYEDIIEFGLVQGCDLLTGSTSTPAKRVQLASNYCIDKDENGTCFVHKIRDKSYLQDYLAESKTIYPFYNRSSAKRQNSATLKDTQELIVPSEDIFRVIVK